MVDYLWKFERNPSNSVGEVGHTQFFHYILFSAKNEQSPIMLEQIVAIKIPSFTIIYIFRLIISESLKEIRQIV